jgi:hypothetical protein
VSLHAQPLIPSFASVPPRLALLPLPQLRSVKPHPSTPSIPALAPAHSPPPPTRYMCRSRRRAPTARGRGRASHIPGSGSTQRRGQTGVYTRGATTRPPPARWQCCTADGPTLDRLELARTLRPATRPSAWPTWWARSGSTRTSSATSIHARCSCAEDQTTALRARNGALALPGLAVAHRQKDQMLQRCTDAEVAAAWHGPCARHQGRAQSAPPPPPPLLACCRYFPNKPELNTHNKYFLFSDSYERAGTVGLRCLVDGED